MREQNCNCTTVRRGIKGGPRAESAIGFSVVSRIMKKQNFICVFSRSNATVQTTFSSVHRSFGQFRSHLRETLNK